MKNLTFSADEDLIERARMIARGQKRTLNAAFREWLEEFTAGEGDARSFDALMKKLHAVDDGGQFSRDELNDRQVLSRHQHLRLFLRPQRPETARKARALIREALTSHKGVVSYQVVQEFFNVALRRFRRPMETHEAEQYLAMVFRPLLAAHSPAALYGEALRLQGHGGLAW